MKPHKIGWLNILSWLLHHANRKHKSPEFYAIKTRILKKYGTHRCYDVQFIEGKKCYSCTGTGMHSKYDVYLHKWYEEECWNCHSGWFKRPVWNILSKVEFGKYTFHQPYQRSYSKPANDIGIIDGYIEHNESKYSDFAAFILFQIYDFNGYWRRYYQSIYGFRVMWWLPRNWLRNAIYIRKFGIRRVINILKEHRKEKLYKPESFYAGGELPF